jgi:imidazolonepropionase-like amidohydrolase
MPFFERIGSPAWYLDRVKSVGPRHFDALRMAIEEGVPMGLGTDQFPFEENDGTTATVRELLYYVEAGMTPLGALRSATVEAARLLGAEKDIGTLEAGKYADLIAVRADPTTNPETLRDIVLVMKGGSVVLDGTLHHR